MLIFKTLRYKNFLSSGNQFTEIQLDKSKSTLIIGSNGAGKSTMLDALTFVLFNKPFRKINKNQLINTTNEKDCVVEIEFSIGKIDWKIVRGIKPAIFEIYKGKKLLDQQASAADQQKWFEKSILKLNYKSFTQIVVLGSSNFVPFMQLSSQHRREVVEDLLDIKVFSSMNDVAKSKIKELRDDIKEIGYKKQNIEDKIELQEQFILKSKNESKTKIDDLKDEICKCQSQIKVCQGYINNDQGEIDLKTGELELLSNTSDKLKKLNSVKAKLSQKVSTITSDCDFFKVNSVCPTCTQNIEETFRLNKIDEYQIKINELKTGYEELEIAITNEENRENKFLEISKIITNLTHEISQNNLRISGFQKRIGDIEHEIQKITDNLENKNIEYEKLESYKKNLEDIISDISDRKEELSNYEFIHMLLKDDGAKTKIIKKYLPVINHSLNKYLDMLEFSVNFTLDEEFNEKALNPIYEDFSYESFSEGEKMRIDLAILFTWREVAKIKNSINTNLLILDEVFDSSLDDYGTDYFTRIIKYVIDKSNVFVISHKRDELLDKFDSTITFEKRKGFSVMVDF